MSNHEHDSSTIETTRDRVTRLAISGATGRVGALIIDLARRDQRIEITHHITRRAITSSSSTIAHDRTAIAPRSIDVVVDFSSDDGALNALDVATHAHAALLIGTTGLSAETLALLHRAATDRPVLIAPNTSLGVCVLARLLKTTASTLKNFDISITELHHTAKKDAPSGTAKRLASVIRDAGAHLDDRAILSIRAGDIVGEHTVRFAGQGEVLEFTHRATSRALFAKGAIEAALWLRDRPPGNYTMDDMLADMLDANTPRQ